jgi:hypothetical protein
VGGPNSDEVTYTHTLWQMWWPLDRRERRARGEGVAANLPVAVVDPGPEGRAGWAGLPGLRERESAHPGLVAA